MILLIIIGYLIAGILFTIIINKVEKMELDFSDRLDIAIVAFYIFLWPIAIGFWIKMKNDEKNHHM